MKKVNFDIRKNRPKLIGYQHPLDYSEIYVIFIMVIYSSTDNAETLVKTGSVVVEIFGDIGQFRPSRSTIFIFSPTLTQKLQNRFSPFLHDVEQLVELLMRTFARRYPIPFRNDRAISAGVGNLATILPQIGCHGNVP